MVDVMDRKFNSLSGDTFVAADRPTLMVGLYGQE